MTGWLRRMLGEAPLPDVERLPDARILFVHIPKTAGISLYTALERWAGAGRSIRFPNGGDDLADYLALPQERIDWLRLIAGHLSWSDLHKRELTGWSAVTVLREPSERTISVYRFVRGQHDHPWHRIASTMSLEQFLDFLAERPPNVDQQCRFVCGRTDADAAFAALETRFLLATTMEHLPAFTEQLSGLLGERLRVGHRNRSRSRMAPEQLTDAAREKLEALNREDLALYRRVRDIGLVGTAAPMAPAVPVGSGTGA